MEKKFLLSSITFILQLVGCLAGDELNVHIHFHGGDQAQSDNGSLTIEERTTSNRRTTIKHCGQANRRSAWTWNRIVGGVRTEMTYPWMVFVETRRNGRFYQCGGAIISSKEILTAAHCVCWSKTICHKTVPKEDVRIAVGQHDLNYIHGVTTFDEAPWRPPQRGVHKLCKKPERHIFYNRLRDKNNDFAILTLCEDLEFTKEVSPVCLPESAGREPDLNEGVDTIITGWGLLGGDARKANTLMEITVQTKPNNFCEENYPHYWKKLTPSMLCGQASGKTICSGDSGGPWVTKVGSNFVLIGISSWNRGYQPRHEDCRPGEPSIAARVSDQLLWIKMMMTGTTLPRA